MHHRIYRQGTEGDTLQLGGAGATPFGGHGGPVLSVAFSPVGGCVASGGQDGIIRIWDVATRTQIAECAGHTDWVSTVAYSRDGGTIASGSDDETIRVWDVSTGQQLMQFSSPGRGVQSVAYSPDGAMLATGWNDGAIRLWDIGAGRSRGLLIGHRDWVRAVAYSPDGAVIASASDDETVRIWDVVTGRQRAEFIGHTGWVWSVSFSPDGSALASAGDDQIIRIWDTLTGAQLAELSGHEESVRAISYSPDSAAIASASNDETVRIWDIVSRQQIAEFTGHRGEVAGVAYSPDGTEIASASDDGSVRIWDIAARKQTAEMAGHTGPILSVTYSADGKMLATGGEDGAIRVWDSTTGRQDVLLAGHDGWVTSIAFAPSGNFIASGGDDGVALVWDIANRQERIKFTGHIGGVNSVACSPDGMSVASGGDDGTIRIWDISSGQERFRLELSGPVMAVAFSPDGKILAGGGDDGSLRIWDPATGKQRVRLTGHGKAVRSIAFDPRLDVSPDSRVLASGGEDATIRMWDTATGQQVSLLSGHTEAVYSVAASFDAESLASTGIDGIIRIWDSTQQQRAQLTGHTDAVLSVAYRPDGTALASAGRDGTIRIWNPESGAQIGGTAFGISRVQGRPLAGIQNDTPSAEDTLGVQQDVETLADLIAATETRPPLAIALIGDWGAGKSSVMVQVEDRVRHLAELARNNPGRTAFAASIRQVRFNAWHYSEDSLWAGLVSHLFRILAASDESLRTAPDISRVQADRRSLEVELDALRQRRRLLKRALDDGVGIGRPASLRAWLRWPRSAAQTVAVTVRLTYRDVRASVGLALAWLILAGGAYAAWYYLGALIGASITALTILTVPATLIIRFIVWLRQNLTTDTDENQQEILQVEERLRLVSAASRLGDFLKEKSAAPAYQEFRGLLGQVHGDLVRLSEELAQARAEWVASGAPPPPPLERIVLYVDDLDRCPPRLVVEVLEAVHLMLALDLFVVVVAVDARWLVRSLEYHHRDLFSATAGNVDTTATPIDYLDKIFQIPYALTSPKPRGMADYLRALLPEPPTLLRQSLTDSANKPASEPEQTVDSGISSSGPGMRLPSPEYRRRVVRDRASRRAPEGFSNDSLVPDLRPLGLQLTQAEVAFMTQLGAVTRTPRAAKRMQNLYRLVRISIPEAELGTFIGDDTGGPYQIVQVLLAILTGHPAKAHDTFTALLAPASQNNLRAILESTDPNNLQTALAAIRPEMLADCPPWCRTLARYSFHTRDLIYSNAS
jgi:WD40 repeat protein